jgi:hypothetical protein
MGCGTTKPSKVHATSRQPVKLPSLNPKRPLNAPSIIRDNTIISNQSQDLFSTTHNKNKIITINFGTKKGTKNSIPEGGSDISVEGDDQGSEDFDPEESQHKYYIKYASLVRDEDLNDIKEAEFCVSITLKPQ